MKINNSASKEKYEESVLKDGQIECGRRAAVLVAYLPKVYGKLLS